MTRAGLILVTTLASMGIGYPGLTPMPTKLERVGERADRVLHDRLRRPV